MDDEYVVDEAETDHGVYRVRLEHDPDCADPREDACHLGVMAVRRRRHIGPEKDSAEMRASEALRLVEDYDWRVVARYVRMRTGASVVLPIWDQGDNGISVGAMDERVPPGNVVGLIYDTPESRAECGTSSELVASGLATEVDEWSKWAVGETYGYVVERASDAESEDWEEVDSCWSYVGDDYAEQSAHDALHAVVKLHGREHAQVPEDASVEWMATVVGEPLGVER